jgi:hypothetical protein
VTAAHGLAVEEAATGAKDAKGAKMFLFRTRISELTQKNLLALVAASWRLGG